MIRREGVAARAATRLGFFVAGFAVSIWAPLIPFVKANVGADEGQLGLLLLCLGFGSVVAMPATGWITARRGARPMIVLGGLGLGIMLPIILTLDVAMALAIVLFVFGASLGAIDVAVNVHGAELERREARPLMSGFHALFSVGGLSGSVLATTLLFRDFSPATTALVGAAITLVATVFAWPWLLADTRAEKPERFTMPRGIVVLLAILAGIMFLVEGAILDWGALLMVQRELVEIEIAGVGYVAFSLAMVVARLAGDWVVAKFGGFLVLAVGGVLTAIGIGLILLTDSSASVLVGFASIGFGAANIVPVIFSAAGRQTVMPPSLAIATVTTVGYAGILIGPAFIGFVANAFDLVTAFWGLALLMLVIPVSARRAGAE